MNDSSRSLFVISLPRSLSSVVYYVARQALGLSEPGWTTDGEVLNNDRFATYDWPAHQHGRKFTRPAEEADAARGLFAFLDQIVKPNGFAYKDVVQPFIVARWMTAADRGLAVLRIRRDLADVALSMLGRHWLYPARTADGAPPQDAEAAFLRGLLDAEAALDAVPAEEVGYDDLIRDEGALQKALEQLTPGSAGPLRYADAAFREAAEKQIARRHSERYQLLSGRLQELRRAP